MNFPPQTVQTIQTASVAASPAFHTFDLSGVLATARRFQPLDVVLYTS